QVCEGFRELHKLGLTHRDITPDNIMVTHQGRQVKIMDFGLVQDSQGILKLFEERDVLAGHDFADNLDKGLIAGTPEYMAPEQITDPQSKDRERQETDTTADVFALSCLFYQLLNGEQLFPWAVGSGGASGKQGLVNYLRYRQAWTDADLRCPEWLDAELWSILRKGLARDPKQRQRTAQEL
ncbi:MAG: protein kinase, partial [Myxococcales bacterium]|nr:protein kinase [Myxococcales bacterium]